MFSCVKWEVRLLILKVKVRNKDKDNIMMKCQMKYHELLLGRRIWAILLVFFFFSLTGNEWLGLKYGCEAIKI